MWPFISQGSSLRSAPLDPLTPLDALLSSLPTSDSVSTSASNSKSDYDSESVALASAALSFAAFRSIPS